MSRNTEWIVNFDLVGRDSRESNTHNWMFYDSVFSEDVLVVREVLRDDLIDECCECALACVLS